MILYVTNPYSLHPRRRLSTGERGEANLLSQRVKRLRLCIASHITLNPSLIYALEEPFYNRR